MAQFYARFVRGETFEDVEKRTVAHFFGWRQKSPVEGDQLICIPEGPLTQVEIDGEQLEVRTSPSRHGLSRRIIGVSEVRLLEILTDEELVKLDCDIDTYLQVWDKIHPDGLAKTNPEVTRLELEPTGHVVDIPEQPWQTIVEIATRRAHDDIVAQEDARVFDGLDPTWSGDDGAAIEG